MNKNIFYWCEQPNNFFIHTFKFYRNFDNIFCKIYHHMCVHCAIFVFELTLNIKTTNILFGMGSIEWLSKSFNFLSIIYDQCMRLSTPKHISLESCLGFCLFFSVSLAHSSDASAYKFSYGLPALFHGSTCTQK